MITSNPIHARVLTRFGPDPADEEAWDELAASSGTRSVFQTCAWHRSWWSAFGDAWQPRVVVVSRGGETIGIAPFAVDLATPHVVRFIGDGRADYCDVLSRERDNPEVLAAVFSALDSAVPWTIVELNNVPSGSATAALIESVCERAGFGVQIDPQYVCPSLVIKGFEDGALRIYNKSSLRRPEHVLARSGQVRYRVMHDADEVSSALEAFFAQHVGRWCHTSTPSLFLDRRNQAFYRALAANLGTRRWLHFSTVDFEGQSLAYHFGFDFGGVLTWYKPSFAIDQARRSPGMIMLRHLIGDAIGQHRDELDFTIGDEAFKQRFANTTRCTLRITVFRDPSRLLLHRSRRAVVGAAKWFSRRTHARSAYGRMDA